jgi:sulfite exporter TauE/SafE
MIYWTALLLGLVGSLHCAGMCGPLALALPFAGRSGAAYLAGRAAYNAGRVVTYCLMGVVFGLLGKTFLLAGVQRWMSILLGILLLAGLFSSRRLAGWLPVTRLVQELKTRMSGLLQRRSVMSLGLLGMLNGLLPCGLVYVAGAAATGTGDVLGGMVYMAAFGLGTVPLMLAISLSGRIVPPPIRLKLARAIPISIFIVATLLILRGMSLGIPYISPVLSVDGAPTCCR